MSRNGLLVLTKTTKLNFSPLYNLLRQLLPKGIINLVEARDKLAVCSFYEFQAN